MPKSLIRMFILGTALVGLGATHLAAQGINLPRASPAAEVSQRIGLTDVTVQYHRPSVNEREIWGGLVPHDQVWRAGANENTTITFSTDVAVEGEPLAAGTYGLHMIPAASGPWTVIFSKNSTSWGSFTYDPAEDALRVAVEPSPNSPTEQLTYGFHGVSNDGATLALDWEKVRVPVKLTVDTTQITLASIREQLRSTGGFTWQGWQQAAAYCLQNKVNLDEALGWINTSIQAEERFANWQTKSQILAATGDAAGAEEAMKTALARAQPLELHNYGRQLIAQGDPGKAMEIFRLNAERNPDIWYVDVGLARGLSALGKNAEAVTHLKKALEAAPQPQQAPLRGYLTQLEEAAAKGR